MTVHTQTPLTTFANPKPERDYTIRTEIPEFTCLCPVTGQPDFATLTLAYIPATACVELKSLKLYIASFRDVGAFHEAVTNDIVDTIAATIEPRYIRLESAFWTRGGIDATVTAEHRADGWQPATPVTLA